MEIFRKFDGIRYDCFMWIIIIWYWIESC